MAMTFEPHKTFTVGNAWLENSLETRLLKIKTVLDSDPLYQNIQVTEASDEGHVTLRVEENIPSDKKSIALKVSIQSGHKTLNENDLTNISKKIVSAVEEKTGAKLRS